MGTQFVWQVVELYRHISAYVTDNAFMKVFPRYLDG
jgi:hypothetical protein